MALEFNPNPYLELFRMKQAERQANQPDLNRDVSQPILQGLQMLSQNRQQQQLVDLQKEKMGMERQAHEYQYGTPQSYNQATGVQPGQANLGLFNRPSPGTSMIDRFNAFRSQQGQMSTIPETEQNMGSLRREEMRKQYGLETDRMKADRQQSGITPYQEESLELQRQRLNLERGKLDMRQTEEEKLKARNQAKLEKERPKAKGSLVNTLREYDNMITEAEAIKNDPNLEMATGASSFMGRLPGGLSLGAKNPRARLETLKAKTLLNVLASLKELSATGASGFGQLSNIEGENLRNSISTLDPDLGTQDFKASIDRFIKEMQTRKSVLQNTFEDTYGEFSGGSGGGDPLGIR